MDFTKDGNEILSQVPLAVPYDKTRPESLNEQIARMVQSQFSQLASENGKETYEDSFDFGDENENDDFSAPLTSFQEDYLPETYDNETAKQGTAVEASGADNDNVGTSPVQPVLDGIPKPDVSENQNLEKNEKKEKN